MPPRANAFAIGSLICGILGCVPFVSGLAAVAFGLVGLRQARRPQGTGTGVAACGIALGVVSLALWALAANEMRDMVRASGEPAMVTREMLQKLSAGDVAAAETFAAPSLSADELTALSERVREFGELRDVSFHRVAHRKRRWTLNGTATFDDDAAMTVAATVDATDDGYRVADVDVERPTTAAAD